MSTTESNKLIVQFMELKPIKVNTDFYALAKNHVHVTGKNTDIVISGFSECAKYNSDWNWLMEVVDKIESIDFVLNIRQGHVSIVNNSGKTPFYTGGDIVKETKMEAVYNTCVKFIKWYNQQNK